MPKHGYYSIDEILRSCILCFLKSFVLIISTSEHVGSRNNF